MLYRREKQAELRASDPTLTTTTSSGIIAEMWWREPAEVRERYAENARVIRQHHRAQHPDWQYHSPRRSPATASSRTSPTTTGAQASERGVCGAYTRSAAIRSTPADCPPLSQWLPHTLSNDRTLGAAQSLMSDWYAGPAPPPARQSPPNGRLGHAMAEAMTTAVTGGGHATSPGSAPVAVPMDMPVLTLARAQDLRQQYHALCAQTVGMTFDDGPSHMHTTHPTDSEANAAVGVEPESGSYSGDAVWSSTRDLLTSVTGGGGWSAGGGGGGSAGGGGGDSGDLRSEAAGARDDGDTHTTGSQWDDTTASQHSRDSLAPSPALSLRGADILLLRSQPTPPSPAAAHSTETGGTLAGPHGLRRPAAPRGTRIHTL